MGVAVVVTVALAAAGELLSVRTLCALVFGLAGYAAYVRPYVDISPGEVVLANPLRTVHVPWPTIQSVSGRLGLRIQTVHGAYTSWAAPQRGRVHEDVLRQLEEHRAGGHLDDPRFAPPRPEIRWNRDVLVPAALLSAFAIALAVGTFF